MKVTEELLQELTRCLEKTKQYILEPGDWYSSATHAALHRSTLDLSKVLSKWRKTPKTILKCGEKEECK